MSQIHRFFLHDLDPEKAHFVLEGDNAKIASKVLRQKVHDSIVLMNGKGDVVEATITNVLPKVVEAKKEKYQKENRLSPELHISIGALKGEKAALVLQKLTEMGVTSISFFSSTYSVSKVDQKKEKKYTATCIEAIRQSGNPFLPEIHTFGDVQSCTKYFLTKEAKICFYEKERSLGMQDFLRSHASSYHIMVGPEGGFSEEELEHMQDHGYQNIRCAPYVLRAETAAIAAAAIVRSCEWGVRT